MVSTCAGVRAIRLHSGVDEAGGRLCLLGTSVSLQGAVVCSLTLHGPLSFLPLTFKGTKCPAAGAVGQIYELVLRSGGTSDSFSDQLLDL